MKKILFFLVFTISLQAQAQLDPSFGNNGISIIGNAGISASTGIVESPSGKYYVTGNYQNNYYYYPFVLAYEHDGTPDASFGNNGLLTFPSDTSLYFSAHLLKLSTDGKLYVGYTRFKNNAGSRATIRQVDTFGVINPSFGSGGLLSFTSPNFNDILLQDMVLDVSQNIVVSARYRMMTPDYNLYQSRYLPNGQIDPSFNSGGVDTTFEMDPSYSIHTLAMPDSSIISCYKRDNASSFSFIKFKQNGVIDSSFGNNGSFHSFYHIFGSPVQSIVGDLKLINDSTILFGGHRVLSNNDFLCMGRLKSTGALDSTFGANGIATYNTMGNSGKIVTDNQDRIYVNNLLNYNVYRYTPIGTFDTGFGTAGTYNARPNIFNGLSRFMLLTDNSKIIMTGSNTSQLNTNFQTSLHRFNLSQTLDNSFGNQGIADRSIGLAADYSFGICMTENTNRYVMVGQSGIPSTNFFAQSRLGLISKIENNGNLDQSFGRNGLETFNRFATIHDVLEQTDGKLIVSGHNGNGNRFRVARLFSDGRVDSSFATNGFSTADHLYNRDFHTSIAQDSKGRIYGNSSRNRDIALFRYTADGQGDTTFANDLQNLPGQAILRYQAVFSFFLPQDLSVQSDDKPIISGMTRIIPDTFSQGYLMRWLETGVPDSTFNQDGVALFNIQPDSSVFWQHRIQSDGKIVASGYRQSNGVRDILVARYNSNGSIDNSFNGNGYTTFSINGFKDEGNTLTVQPDGKIMIMGNAQINASLPLNELYALRLNSNGSLDNSFGTNGIFKFSTSTNGDEFCYQSILDKEGKIILAGYTNQDGHDEMFAAKFLTGLSIGLIDRNLVAQTLLLYPNPIQDQAKLNFELDKSQSINIRLVDMTGKTVKQLVTNQKFEKGEHTVSLQFNGLSNGNYLLQIGNASMNQTVQLTVRK